jgi:hypothetical protein
VDLYNHSLIRPHGVLLNQLSTWTTLPFTYNIYENVLKCYNNIGPIIINLINVEMVYI